MHRKVQSQIIYLWTFLWNMSPLRDSAVSTFKKVDDTEKGVSGIIEQNSFVELQKFIEMLSHAITTRLSRL